MSREVQSSGVQPRPLGHQAIGYLGPDYKVGPIMSALNCIGVILENCPWPPRVWLGPGSVSHSCFKLSQVNCRCRKPV
eukprot:3921909-Rhodomonas_salina.2